MSKSARPVSRMAAPSPQTDDFDDDLQTSLTNGEGAEVVEDFEDVSLADFLDTAKNETIIDNVEIIEEEHTFGEFLNEGVIEEVEPLTTEEIITSIIDPLESLPDLEFMIEYLASYELDDRKSAKFIHYIQSIDDNARLALWESFKASYGNSPATATATAKAQALIKSVDRSQSLKLRNNAVHSELSRIASLHGLLSRHFRSNLSDTPLNSFRIENTAQLLQENNRNLTLLNSAIIEMARMLMVGGVDEEESADMAINVDRALKICATVGFSAKTWAKVYDQAATDRKQFITENEGLKTSLRNAMETAQATMQALANEKKQLEALTLHATSYVIGNHSGNFITTVNKPTEDTKYFRVSPYNLRLTQERDEALELDDIEIAREVFDAVQVWGNSNYLVRRLFKTTGVDHSTLFISAASLIKVV